MAIRTSQKTRRDWTPARRAVLQRAAQDRAQRAYFEQQRVTPTTRDPEWEWSFWHPDRQGVKRAPAADLKTLHAFHPDLSATWHPLKERWLVWYRKPSIQHHLCPGWLLLFVWEHAVTETYLPLTIDLVIANCYARSRMLFPNGEVYLQRLLDEAERTKAAETARDQDEVQQRSKSYYDYTKIKSIGRGSKSALHDSDGLPSRGELNWRAQTAWQRMPQEVRDRMTRDHERRRANLAEGRKTPVVPRP